MGTNHHLGVEKLQCVDHSLWSFVTFSWSESSLCVVSVVWGSTHGRDGLLVSSLGRVSGWTVRGGRGCESRGRADRSWDVMWRSMRFKKPNKVKESWRESICCVSCSQQFGVWPPVFQSSTPLWWSISGKGGKCQILVCHTQANLLFCKKLNTQFSLFFSQL